MAKKKPRHSPAPQHHANHRAVEALTVAWMLSVMATLVCSIVAGGVAVAAHYRIEPGPVLLFARLLHFSAVVTSLVSLVLMAIVLKTRKDPPPTSILAFAAIVSALPLLAALL